MSRTITGTISTGVTLTAQDTTISQTARVTTDPGVDAAVDGALNASTALTVANYGTIIGSNHKPSSSKTHTATLLSPES